MAKRSPMKRHEPGTRRRPPHPGEAERLAERRAKVWALIVAGARASDRRIRRISAALNLSVTTVWRDVQWGRRQQSMRAEASIGQAREIELEHLGEISSSLYPDRANPKAAQALVNTSAQRSKILGLYSPEQQEHSGPGGGPVQVQSVPYDLNKMTSEQLDALREAVDLLDSARALPISPAK